MKIVCLGDSLTYGYGVPRKENWISLLNKSGPVNYINKGINGDTSGGMLARFGRDVVEEKPNMVIIMGGINDFIIGSGIETVRTNIMAMVHQAYYHRIIPVVAVPVRFDIETISEDWADFADFKETAEKTKLLRSWIIDFGKVFHTECLDLYDGFAARTQGEYSGYFVDGLHPDKKGHKIIAEIVGDKIASIGESRGRFGREPRP